ncbi:MAG: oligosaccharide repeat unit polymerase [Muribaculaceae bacterium]|nr:oligosaccharide repeat unit polymerase [Muribaculaceae bacterium]
MQKRIKHSKKIIWSLLLLYGLCLFIFAPTYYQLYFNIICTISYFAVIFLYYKEEPKTNYFDFDTLFLISYFFVSFFYPTFIYPVNPEIFWMFQYHTDEAIISKASALSLVGIIAYMYGSITYHGNIKIVKLNEYSKNIKTNGLFITSVISFIIYILLGGYSALKNTYSSGERDEGGLYTYFSIIVYVCIFCMITIWFMNSYRISKKKLQMNCFPVIQIAYIIIYIFFLICAGSRGKVLNIILLTFGLYSYLYKPFSFRKVIVLCAIGMVGMFSIMIYRSGGVFSFGSLAEIAMDLIINNHNTYESMTIVDTSGLSYGRSMLSYILGIIPFFQGLFFGVTGIDPDTANSAMIITQSTLGTTDGTGTGTTIIADIYLAFGSIGVILFMGTLGRVVRKLLIYAKNNIYYLLIYGVLTGMSVYLARAEFFYPAKTVVWCCFLLYIVKHHKRDSLFRHKVDIQ